MTIPVPKIQVTPATAAGKVFNLLLEGTLAVDSQLRRYGYQLVPEGYGPGQVGGMEFDTDLADKQNLSSYGSPNVSDRDLVRTPRITQGDWSGGSLQVNATDFSRYWDSDLDISTPEYLRLRPQWKRIPIATPTGGTGAGCVIAPAGSALFLVAQQSDTVYRVNANGTFDSSSPPVSARDLDSDGEFVYIMANDGGSIYRALSSLVGGWTLVASNMQGAGSLMWLVKLSSTPGLSGFYLYYVNAANQLWRIDLANSGAFPNPTHTQIAINGNDTVLDVAPYQNGIAILCKNGGGTTGGAGSQFSTILHYNDGVSTTRLLQLDGYVSDGMCNLLGDLYLSLITQTSFSGALLAKVTAGGQYSVVVDPNPPGSVNATGTIARQPRSSGTRVYWPQGGQYHVLETTTGAYSHYAAISPNDPSGASAGNRTFYPAGKSIIAPIQPAGTNTPVDLQVTQDTTLAGNGTVVVYSPTGTLVSSLFDGGTPTIPKQFRRVNVWHKPLPTNTAIKCDVYVDSDPVAWTSGSTPLATVTNSTVGSTKFTVQLPSATMGLGLFYVLTLTTSDGVSSPAVQRVSIELNPLWIVKFKLDCTANIQTLMGQPDPQGLRGVDRTFFLVNAWEDAIPLTMYDASGVVYTCEIEELVWWRKAPKNVATELLRADTESWIELTLRVTGRS